MNNLKGYSAVIGTLQKKKEKYQPVAIGDISKVSDQEWAEHWRPHGSGWANPSDSNICYLERAYGGSDMSAIMQCSHFKTRLELFNQKIGVQPVLKRELNGDAKDLGHLYETPTALKYHMWRRKNGMAPTMLIEGKVFNPDGKMSDKPNPASMMMYRDGRLKPGVKQYSSNKDFLYPWALANCDGLLKEEIDGQMQDGILEIKTTSYRNFDVIENWKSGVMPEAYFWQIVYYMAILNVMFADIYCSWGQSYDEAACIRLYRDYDVEKRLFAMVAEFDEYVEQGIEPDTDMDDGSLLMGYYYSLFGPADTKAPMVELPSEKFKNTILRAQQIDANIAACEKALADAKAESAKIYAELYPVFKNSAYGQCRISDDEVVAITLNTPMHLGKFDEDRFKNDYPTLYEECKVFSAVALNEVDKKLKKEYTLPKEPNPDKLPSFKLKVLQKSI